MVIHNTKSFCNVLLEMETLPLHSIDFQQCYKTTPWCATSITIPSMDQRQTGQRQMGQTDRIGRQRQTEQERQTDRTGQEKPCTDNVVFPQS